MSEQTNWYYSWENSSRGPADRAELQVLVAQGFLTADSWVWRETWVGWQRLSATELRELLSFSPRVVARTGSSPVPPALPAFSAITAVPPLLPVSRSSKKRLKRSWRQFGFNLLVFCAALAALAVSILPLFSSVSLGFSLPVGVLATIALAWSSLRKTPRVFPLLSVFAALGAVVMGLWTFHAENQRKLTLTELLAIHDRGAPTP